MRISDWSSDVCSSDLLLARKTSTHWSPVASVLYAAGALVAAFVLDLQTWRGAGMTGEVSGQGAVVHAFLSLQGMITGVAVLMTGYLAARNSRALVTRPRHNSMDLTVIFIRSEERRVGKACVSKCRYRGSRDPQKKT